MLFARRPQSEQIGDRVDLRRVLKMVEVEVEVETGEGGGGMERHAGRSNCQLRPAPPPVHIGAPFSCTVWPKWCFSLNLGRYR